jgi:hypothetical protein
MPKRKSLSTDVTSYLIVHPGAEDPNLPNQDVFARIGDYEPAVAKFFTLTEGNRTNLSSAIGAYVAHRLIRVHPITWDDLLVRFGVVGDAVGVLVDELGGPPLGLKQPSVDWQLRIVRDAAFGRIAAELRREKPDQDVGSIRACIRTLGKVVPAAVSRALAERAAGKTISHDRPFFAFISELADIFEFNVGARPTATKTSNAEKPNISTFVEFVWVMMTTAVPKALREHTASPDAMSKAVSAVLAKLRKTPRTRRYFQHDTPAPAITLEDPLTFELREKLDTAARDRGFPFALGIEGRWLHFGSSIPSCSIWIAGASSSGPGWTSSRHWLLSVEHLGVAAEVDGLTTSAIPGPGAATFIFDEVTSLGHAIERVFKLGMSLPDAPFLRFCAKTADMPRTTQAEQLMIQRIGQDVFRDALMNYWCGRCPLTGITDPSLLKASHIVPWDECKDPQRLDVHNGLLLSALWHTAFEEGAVSFADDGRVLANTRLSDAARKAVGLHVVPPLRGLRDAHRVNLALHRSRHGFDQRQ